jgi:hypothetical protein
MLNYTKTCPKSALFHTWGHSLSPINPNKVLRVFLQNPNGLSIHNKRHLLTQVLQTCYDYGVGVLCLPETNTNWDQAAQRTHLRDLFHGIWSTSCIQTSRAPEPFTSNYQPGGNMTAICKIGFPGSILKVGTQWV